jgi:hypothetical protein
VDEKTVTGNRQLLTGNCQAVTTDFPPPSGFYPKVAAIDRIISPTGCGCSIIVSL